METVRPRGLRLPVPRPAAPFRLPQPIWLTMAVLQGALLLVAGMFLLNRWTQPPSPPRDPFAPFADLMPGQVAADLAHRGFACAAEADYLVPMYLSSSTTCSHWPIAGTFDHIEVILSDDSKVRQTTFSVRPDTLRLGDLALLWGRPPIIDSIGSITIWTWPQLAGSVLAAVKPGRFSYFLPLHRVTFLQAANTYMPDIV